MQSIIPPDAYRHSPLLVAFSGGLDSSVLLHALATDADRRANGLRALHVHHGLQAQADAWAEHCRRRCQALDVPLEIVRVQVEPERGQGTEAAARHARYRAIADALGEDEILVTAHHRDDQSETFLLRALRASGPDGLAAMRPWRRFGKGWHWRPLLDATRAELLAYARTHALAWIEDASNTDTDFDRNFLRHEVLPLLRRRWPQADAAFARSATLCAEAADLLAGEDAHALAAAATDDPHELSVPALLALPTERRSRVLRRWIEALALPSLPGNGVERIETEILPAPDDAEARFDWSGAGIRRWRDRLRADVFPPPLPPHWQQQWDGRLPLVLPGGGWLALEGVDALPAPVRAHARRGGERIALPGRPHASQLKKLLQERGIPTWMREIMPLLSDADGELLAAGDAILSAGFDAWLKRHHARLCWKTPDPAAAGEPDPAKHGPNL
ncbi:MAG: tRNA lysidine(34) synthetase TilS [Pseudoxanthomonas sp.]